MNKLCEQAVLYFYGELNETQTAQFRAHLTGCAACQKELAFLEKMQTALVAPAAPQAVVEKVLVKFQPVSWWRRYYKIALAATLVVGLGVWGFFHQATLQNTDETETGWLAYVSDELDTEYYNFMEEFEEFEENF